MYAQVGSVPPRSCCASFVEHEGGCYEVVITARAESQVRTIEQWWRVNIQQQFHLFAAVQPWGTRP